MEPWKVLELSTIWTTECHVQELHQRQVEGTDTGCKSHSCFRPLWTRIVKEKASSGSFQGQKWIQPVGSIVFKLAAKQSVLNETPPGLWKCQELVCSELVSPLCGNKAHAHAESVGGWGWGQTGSDVFLFGFQIGPQKEES